MTLNLSKTLTALAFGAITLTLTACGGDKAADSQAQTQASGGTDDVAARQALMKDWRGANEIIKGMLENPANFDAKLLQEQTKVLADGSKAWAHFADANQKGKSQDAVWSDAEGFKAAAKQFDDAAAALNTAAQTATSVADIEALAGKVGESCGSCHKVFKQK